MSPVEMVLLVCTAMTSSPTAPGVDTVTGGGEAAENWKAHETGVAPVVVRNQPRKSGVGRRTPTWSRPPLTAATALSAPALPFASHPTYGGTAREVLPWMGWLVPLGWLKVTSW